jgi:nitric oxide reductase subunit B
MNYMEVQDQVALFYWMRLGAGVVVLIGVTMIIWSLVVAPRGARVTAGARQPAE